MCNSPPFIHPVTFTVANKPKTLDANGIGYWWVR
nr:MAG TPA: hypothetical protein [Caudoviricetes sp.]